LLTRNCAALLAEMGCDSGQILARLNNLARRFGISFSSDAVSEITRQSQKGRTLRSSSSLKRYRGLLISILRRVTSFLGFAGTPRRR
jgi:hypothetical protein